MLLYDNLCCEKLIKKCWDSIYYSKTIEIRKKSAGIDGITLENFKSKEVKYITEIVDQLKCGRYKFSEVRMVARKKEKKGEYRAINISTVADSIVQKAILSLLAPVAYEHIKSPVNYSGSRKTIWPKVQSMGQMTQVVAMKKLIQKVKDGNFFVFETDIAGFYDRILKRKLVDKLARILPEKSLLPLIRQIIYFKIGNPSVFQKLKQQGTSLPSRTRGIAQGSILSPIFSNIYLAHFDEEMFKFCGDNLIRYVDDFIIFGKDYSEIVNAGTKAKKLINAEGLELKPNKTHHLNLRHSTLKFLGLRVNKEEISAKQSKDKILAKFKHKKLNQKNYQDQHRNVILEGRATKKVKVSKVDQMNEKIAGWVDYYENFHTESILAQINLLIEEKRNSNSQFRGLKNVRESDEKHIIDRKCWQQLFVTMADRHDPTSLS